MQSYVWYIELMESYALVHGVIAQLYFVGFSSVEAHPCLEQNICTALFTTVVQSLRKLWCTMLILIYRYI